MNDLKRTIGTARGKGMDDAAIQNLLVKAGWDADVAAAALQGIFVPKPPSGVADGQPAAPAAAPASTGVPSLGLVPAPVPAPEHHADTAPRLSALEAALHHVLLWFFTLSMTITIGVVSATIFGTSQSIDAVTTFLATSFVTLLAFGFFYLRYVRRLKQEPSLTTNRIWSTITIVVHSVGALAALITLLAAAINAGGNGTMPIIVAAAIIALLDGLVVAVYAHATFVGPDSKRRLLIIKAFPALVLLLLVSFMVVSVMKVGPLRADERTREALVESVGNVRNYANDKLQLPASATDVELPSGIEYERRNTTSYRVCANFETGGASDDYTAVDQDDNYVSRYTFANEGPGRQCFTFRSYTLVQNQDGTKYNSPIMKELQL